MAMKDYVSTVLVQESLTNIISELKKKNATNM